MVDRAQRSVVVGAVVKLEKMLEHYQCHFKTMLCCVGAIVILPSSSMGPYFWEWLFLMLIPYGYFVLQWSQTLSMPLRFLEMTISRESKLLALVFLSIFCGPYNFLQFWFQARWSCAWVPWQDETRSKVAILFIGKFPTIWLPCVYNLMMSLVPNWSL